MPRITQEVLKRRSYNTRYENTRFGHRRTQVIYFGANAKRRDAMGIRGYTIWSSINPEKNIEKNEYLFAFIRRRMSAHGKLLFKLDRRIKIKKETNKESGEYGHKLAFSQHFAITLSPETMCI